MNYRLQIMNHPNSFSGDTCSKSVFVFHVKYLRDTKKVMDRFLKMADFWSMDRFHQARHKYLGHDASYLYDTFCL